MRTDSSVGPGLGTASRARLDTASRAPFSPAKQVDDLAVQPHHVQPAFDRRVAVADEDQIEPGHNVDHLPDVTAGQERSPPVFPEPSVRPLDAVSSEVVVGSRDFIWAITRFALWILS